MIFSISANGQKYHPLFDSIYSALPENEQLQLFDSLVIHLSTTVGAEDAAMMAHDFSLKYYQVRNYQNSLKYGYQEAALYEQINLKNKTYAKAIYQIGFVLQKIPNADSAITRYEKVIEDNLDPVKTAKAHCRIGECFALKGDFHKSITRFQKGVSQLEKMKAISAPVSEYLNMAGAYENIRDKSYQKDRLNLLNKIQALKEKGLLSTKRTAIFHNLMGSYYNAKENSSGKFDFQKAKYHYQQLLQIGTKLIDSSKINTAYVNMGNLYQKEKKDNALFFLNKSLAYGPSVNEEILIYRNLYDYYSYNNKFPAALANINKSLAINLSVPEDSLNLVDYPFYYNSVNQDEVLAGIIKKVHILIKLEKENSADNRFLRLAEKLIDIADRLITSVQNESTTEDSKLYWRERATDIYSKGVLLASKFNNFEKAFYYSEKIKSLLLIENILTESSKDSLPDEIKSHEVALKSTVLEKERQLRNTLDEKQQKELKAEIINDKVVYQNFLDSIQHIYPEFYANKNNVAIADLKLLQNQLDDSSVVVSYLWDIDDDNYDHVYFLLITKSGCEVQSINGITELGQLIEDFNSVITKPFETPQEIQRYQSIANQLYLKLIPTADIRERIKGKKLLILPDHNIHGIPFEALVTDKSSGKFLIEENEISYAYSMSFLFHNEKIKRSPSKQMIAFSPIHFQYDSLAPLRRTASEITEIQKIIDGKTLLNQNSSKAAFFAESGDYKIIHLATHAQAGKNPWVAFSDQKMDITELHTFQNQAELVVLSACNTSLGQIAQGEGILSLARSFFFSGANSIVASLWNVNDKSTSYIFKDFYQNLQAGESKSAALRKAKLKYLKSHSLSEASPYYWASFTLLGNSQPIDLQPPGGNTKWLIIALLLVAIIAIIIFLKKKS